MQRLIRFLVIYIAVVVTIISFTAIFTLRDNTQHIKNMKLSIDSLKGEMSKITAYQKLEKEKTQAKLDNLKLDIAASSPSVQGVSNQASQEALLASGFVTINDKKWQIVDVYESNSYSSKVIGKIQFDQIYRYLTKTDNSWYQIVLPSSEKNGWVAGRFVMEVEDNGPASP